MAELQLETQAIDIGDFLAGVSDMLARTKFFTPNRRVRDLHSTYDLVNEVVNIHVNQKLYVAVYRWVEGLIRLFKSMNTLLDEFLGAFAFNVSKSDIIIDLIKTESSEIEKELFAPLERTGMLNEFLDWLVADKDYCSGVTDHRFIDKAVNLLAESIDIDTLFTWYRQGLRLKDTDREFEEGGRDQMARWAVSFVEALNDAHSRQTIEAHDESGGVEVLDGSVTDRLEVLYDLDVLSELLVTDIATARRVRIPLSVFEREDVALRWILAYRWFRQLNTISEAMKVNSSPEEPNRNLFSFADIIFIHQDCIENLVSSFNRNESDFVEVLETFVKRFTDFRQAVCANKRSLSNQ